MTIWYRQGTASVENGSTSVTGALTTWLNQVKPGDGITFDDGGSWHEVASVESNTALTLATEYGGETVSGAAYAIDRRSPQWSLASDLAVKVAALLGKITTLLLTAGKPNDGIGNDGAIAFDPDAQLFYFKSGGAWDGGTSVKGDGGWSPVFALASDGERRVLQVVDWVGGESEKPPVDLYVGVSGLTETIGEAADVRGAQGASGDDGSDGADGNDGWSPILAAVADSDRRVVRVVDWVGGEGTKPATGKYLGPSGLVDAVGDGTDVRGPAGSGAGDVTGPGATVVAGEIAVFSDTTGEAIEGAGVTIADVMAGAGSREYLTGPLTLYVRGDGSDTNDGRADNSGGAFLTPQAAYNTIAATLDLGGQTVTVQLGDGTYGGVDINQPWTGGGKVIFRGNNSTPSNVEIAATSDHCFDISSPLPGVLQILDLKMSTTTSGSCIAVTAPASIEYGNVDFGAAATFHVHANASGVNIAGISAYTISGGALYHWVSTANAHIKDQSKTITLTGTPTFGAFAYGTRGGLLVVNANTFSGSANGARYLIDNNGIVFTNGAGASYLPGDSAGSGGTTTGGGIYS